MDAIHNHFRAVIRGKGHQLTGGENKEQNEEIDEHANDTVHFLLNIYIFHTIIAIKDSVCSWFPM